MRLLQLNAWAIRLATRVEDMIVKEVPDVLALQEVLESEVELGYFPTLTEFTDKVQFRHQYFSPAYGQQFMGRQAEFGNAILSNLAFEDTQTVFTNLEYKENLSSHEDDYNVRNFQHAIIRDQDGTKFHLINHHGYHVPESKKGNNLTLKACRQIADYAAGLEGPIIIAGDFNLEPESKSMDIFNERFRNLTKEYNFATTRTDLTHKTESCDFILVNGEVKVKDFYTSTIVASDHMGLILDFEV